MEAASPSWFINEIRRLEDCLQAAGIDDQHTLARRIEHLLDGVELSPKCRARSQEVLTAIARCNDGRLMCADVDSTLYEVVRVCRLVEPFAGQLGTKLRVWLGSSSRSRLADTTSDSALDSWLDSTLDSALDSALGSVDAVAGEADRQLTTFVTALTERGARMPGGFLLLIEYLQALISQELERPAGPYDETFGPWLEIRAELDSLQLEARAGRLQLLLRIDSIVALTRVTHARIDQDLQAWESGAADKTNVESELDNLHAGAVFLRDLGSAILEVAHGSSDFRHDHLGPDLLARVDAARIAASTRGPAIDGTVLMES